MSERYERLFALPENLYAETAPVLIAAGALLKDTRTGSILAQLKLESITAQELRAVKVQLVAMDVAGKPLGETIAHTFLDLQVQRGMQFGQKEPIVLPDATTRAFSARVQEVVFADGSIWTATDSSWQPLGVPMTLEDALGDESLAAQYQIENGENCRFVPRRMRDLWQCTCGAYQPARLHECDVCGNAADSYARTDWDALAKARDARCIVEAQEAAEQEAARVARAAKEDARMRKIYKYCGAALAVVVALAVAVPRISASMENGKAYKEAVSYMEAREYKKAENAFAALEGYKDSEKQVQSARDAAEKEEREAQERAEKEKAYQAAQELLIGGFYLEAADAFAKLGDYQDSPTQLAESQKQTENMQALIAKQPRERIAAGGAHTVGLQADGTVVAIGDDGKFGRCNVADWTDIVQISAGYYHTVGLKADGTVVANGDDRDGRHSVDDWTDIVAVSAGGYYTVGLKKDGTLVATNCESFSSEWTNTVQISAGNNFFAALNADGAVSLCGDLRRIQSMGSEWSNIVQVSAGSGHVAGLKPDGTVVAIGDTSNQRCKVCDWKNIIAVSAGSEHTVGLKSDGTVVATGTNRDGECNVEGWTDIVAVSAGNMNTVGLKADGTVVATGRNKDGQCNVADWKLATP